MSELGEGLGAVGARGVDLGGGGIGCADEPGRKLGNVLAAASALISSNFARSHDGAPRVNALNLSAPAEAGGL
jgi:hypothetical protein